MKQIRSKGNNNQDSDISKAERKKKIYELARSVRKKYLALKLGKSEEDEALQKLFKPVTIPLQEIINTKKLKEKALSRSNRGNKMVKGEQEKKVKVVGEKRKSDVPFLSLENVASTSDDVHSDSDGNDDVFEKQENVSQAAKEEYKDSYPQLSHQYITNFWDASDNIDQTYGPRYDPVISAWYLGEKRMDFDLKTGDIIINSERFKGTSGLYELIFYKQPEFTEDDKLQYKQILTLTNAHKDVIGRLKPSTMEKYKNIIRPLFKDPVRSQSSSSHMGKGHHLIYNKKPTEYVYWDDVNELVDRLKLLIASKEAGNDSHNNEIIAIINELKEAGIIQ